MPQPTYKLTSFRHLRGIVSVLLFLLTVQTIAPMLVFTVIQKQIRREMRKRIKAGVNESDLVHLAIPREMETTPNPAFQRIHEREFRFEGRMYDIVRKQEVGDTTYYACIYDAAETELFVGLQRMMQDEMQNNPERKKQQWEIRRLQETVYLATEGPDLKIHDFGDGISIPWVIKMPQWVVVPQKPPPEYFAG